MNFDSILSKYPDQTCGSILGSMTPQCSVLSSFPDGTDKVGMADASSASLQASPLRPRRFTLGPTRGGVRERDRDTHAVHLQWLVGYTCSSSPVFYIHVVQDKRVCIVVL